MRERRLQLSLALPLVCLACWVTLVLVPTTLIFLNMKVHADRTGGFTYRSQTIEGTISRERLLPFALHDATIHTALPIAAINVPAFLVEILISLPTSWPQTLHPSQYLLEDWRALTYPIYALLAWWSVGRSLDGLLGRKRLGTVEVILNSLAAIGFLVLGLGLRFGVSPAERDSILIWFSCGLVLWAVLAGIAPMAWLRQRKKDDWR